MGQLATTREHWDNAERHFFDALRLHQSWKWWLYVPWTQYGWALMLSRRNLSTTVAPTVMSLKGVVSDPVRSQQLPPAQAQVCTSS